MLSQRAWKTWTWLHTWSSLVCTVFMLLLCLTGLPLIFHHEIGHLLGFDIFAQGYGASSLLGIALVGVGGGLGLHGARRWRAARNASDKH